MRIWPLILAGFAGITASASGSTQLPQQVQNVLTSIDSVPTQLQLDSAFNDHQQAMHGLAAIASDFSADTGMRLRAIHALTRYCTTTPCTEGDTAHQALAGLIDNLWDAASGENVVVLRGAIEAIGPQRVGTDLNTLFLAHGLLNHPSRDIRAATALALRDLCNTQAVTPLLVQYQQETTDQVRLAISEALRILRQPQPCQ